MKLVLFILATLFTLTLSNISFAGSPMAFDKWSVNNGNISTGCSIGYQCGNGLDDQGFFQRGIQETSTGRKYFQTIVTDHDQTGVGGTTSLSFSNESFTAIGRNAYGLANKQHIYSNWLEGNEFNIAGQETLYDDNGDEITFDSENTTLTGWATSRGNGTDVEFDFSQIIAMGIDTGINGKNMTYNMRQRIADTNGTLGIGVEGLTLTSPVAYNSGDYIKASWYSHEVQDQTFGWMTYEEGSYGASDFWSFDTGNTYSLDQFGTNMYEFASNPDIDAPFDTTL